jgi:hypothetical protein
MKKAFLLLFAFTNLYAVGQCDIKTVIRPDGNTIQYFNPKPIIIQNQFEIGTAIYKNVSTGKFMINITILFKSLPRKKLEGDLTIQTSGNKGLILKIIKSEEVDMNGRKVSIALYEIDKKSLIEIKKYSIKNIFFNIGKKMYGESISTNNNIYINEIKCF